MKLQIVKFENGQYAVQGKDEATGCIVYLNIKTGVQWYRHQLSFGGCLGTLDECRDLILRQKFDYDTMKIIEVIEPNNNAD